MKIPALLLTCFLAVAAGGDPRFEDYPSEVRPIRHPVPARITDAFTRRYKTQLRRASSHDSNFAGHYVLAQWGCGASCVVAAAIDTQTGGVTPLPFTVSGWPLDVTEPLQFKLGSRLLIVRGSRDEKPAGIYFYEFASGKFNLLVSESVAKP